MMVGSNPTPCTLFLLFPESRQATIKAVGVVGEKVFQDMPFDADYPRHMIMA